MDGPGGSAARRRIRIGDAERERYFALLREHYAAGRLSLEELRSRTETVVSACYADEADAALAELPVIAPVMPATSSGTAPPRRGLFARKGHAQATRPAPGWVRTDERFRDPSTRTIMRVWIDPADGSRHYVPDDPAT
jgi:Domain of unknown function (DUF1707)